MRVLINDNQVALLRSALLVYGGAEAETLIADIDEQMATHNSDQANQYREAAKGHQVDGEIEIDEDAVVSIGTDPGAYVEAWLWVYDEELKKSG